ncbi:CD99 antigen-like isoform X2 [Varanus komodoensis]|uniref:CD99 molecule (Xg blood group) n=1 Tax=Varanus komodoensis TaxID=61221 RepID=A0A8D2L0G1_VARKO|nr:CD99 antigen-like isoform X2 [Varanus komodoensis]
MRKLLLFVSLSLVLLATHCRGQDFDLSDALPSHPTSKPSVPSKKPPSDGGFDLGDAIDDQDSNPAPPPPPPQPKPGSHGNSGELSDLDLVGGKLPPEEPPAGGGNGGSTENTEGSQGMLAGIISSVVVAVVGAASSFIAYQKKKLCFKASDQENVNMESQQGAHAEPPVQRTLLQKQ